MFPVGKIGVNAAVEVETNVMLVLVCSMFLSMWTEQKYFYKQQNFIVKKEQNTCLCLTDKHDEQVVITNNELLYSFCPTSWL